MKTKFIYKAIAPDLEKAKTEAILRICREALKRQAAEKDAIDKSKGELYAVSKRSRELGKD